MMKICVAIVLLVMVPSGVVWQEMKKGEPLILREPVKEPSRADVTQPQAQTQDQQNSAPDVLSPLKAQPQSPTPNPGTQQADEKGQHEPFNGEWWMVMFTGALVVVGFLQILLVGMQALYMWKGLRATQQSAQAAQASADAAMKSAGVAETALRLGERAYLATDHWEIKGDVVMCFVTNVGRMPATLINGSLGHFALVGDSPDPPLQLRQRREITFKDTHIPAQASFPLKVSNLDRAVQPSIAHPTHAFHAFVHVNYLDGFGRQLTLHADMRYDVEIRNFVIDGPRTLIEEDSNKKWDPYS